MRGAAISERSSASSASTSFSRPAQIDPCLLALRSSYITYAMPRAEREQPSQ
jgi:hypothetical protein